MELKETYRGATQINTAIYMELTTRNDSELSKKVLNMQDTTSHVRIYKDNK
jgi:hypothetical protein